MAFDAGSIVAHLKADTTNFSEGLKKAKAGTDDMKTGFASMGKLVTGVVGAIGAAVAAVGVVNFLKDSTEEAANFEKAMVTLDIIAGRFGESGAKAQEVAKGLGKELRVGTGAAAAGLQNLLKSGLNLDQAADLMKRFTNEAITGKSSSISLSQAVENLSFAYATNNSAIGNLSGINENFVNIIDRGREALLKEGVAANKITDEMAKYKGMIELTNLTMGSAERFQGSYIDMQAQLAQKMTELKVALGQQLLPLLTQFINLILNSGIIEGFTAMVTSIGEGSAWLANAWNTNFMGIRDTTMAVITELNNFFINYLMPALNALRVFWDENHEQIMATVGVAWAIIGGIIRYALDGIYTVVKVILALMAGDWEKANKAITDMNARTWDMIKGILNTGWEFIKNWGGKIFSDMVRPFEDAWNKIRDLMNKIKDALDFTKRHSPSVIDIVNNGVSLVNKAFEGLPGMGAVAPHMGMQMAGVSAGGGGMTNMNVTISMDGAIVSDDLGAQRMAENVGNLIIKKLQNNIRF